MKHAKQYIHLASRTQLHDLQGHTPFVLLDWENIAISLRNEGRELSPKNLKDRIEQVAPIESSVAVLSTAYARSREIRRIDSAKWIVHRVPQRIMARPASGSVTRLANSDLDICFEAGWMVRHPEHDSLLLATGDGDLSQAIVAGYRRHALHKKTFALTVLGANSSRQSQWFDGIIHLGTDVLDPMGPSPRPPVAVVTSPADTTRATAPAHTTKAPAPPDCSPTSHTEPNPQPPSPPPASLYPATQFSIASLATSSFRSVSVWG